jgi:hypothetical protein
MFEKIIARALEMKTGKAPAPRATAKATKTTPAPKKKPAAKRRTK